MKSFLSRRRFGLSGLAALSSFAAPGIAAAASEADTLAAAGATAGLEVGSAIRSDPPEVLARLIARECTLVTPETALKPAYLSPTEGRFRWAEAERTYRFAAASGLGVHGHTLFWHRQPLAWAVRRAEGATLDEVTAIYGGYLDAVIRHFPQTRSWDVLNEIASTRGLLRETFPIAEFGVDFIERLLHRARAAAPGAMLAINENDLECAAADCRAKRKHVLTLLRELRARGAPLDALGLQGHLSSHRPPAARETRAFIDEVGDLGLVVFISEMDVNDSALPRDERRRDEAVAAIYAEFLGAVLGSPAVRRVVFWGIADAANWIADGGPRRRADGAPQRPALFDRELRPKPAYHAVREALRNAPKR